PWPWWWSPDVADVGTIGCVHHREPHRETTTVNTEILSQIDSSYFAGRLVGEGVVQGRRQLHEIDVGRRRRLQAQRGVAERPQHHRVRRHGAERGRYQVAALDEHAPVTEVG